MDLILKLFIQKHSKIYPTEYIGNRRRSQTEYNNVNYQEKLPENNKHKTNKKNK